MELKLPRGVSLHADIWRRRYADQSYVYASVVRGRWWSVFVRINRFALCIVRQPEWPNGNAKQPSTRCLTAPLRGNTNTARLSMDTSTRYRAAGVVGRARVGSSTALAQRCPYMPQPCTKLKHGQKEWPQREMGHKKTSGICKIVVDKADWLW